VKLLLLASGYLIASGIAVAQTLGCDEGVIRLPDRSGTIQICSALAARVPELAGQLKQATATLGSQQAQIAELTRLVRGLNNVSRDIGLQRQTEMLQSLSAELEKMRKERGKEPLAQINERLDGLQASLLAALTNPKTAAALSDALKGPVGDAIARLDLGAASRQIDDISERLKAIQSRVDNIQGDTTAIRQQLTQMDQRQQAAEGARQERETVTIDLLKRLSGQVRELGQRGGLIENARTFAEHYHNARILSQRGETDLALTSYRAVFRSSVQMADPVIDLVTLLTRQYGRRGAAEALRRDFQGQLPNLSYLYALQLLSDRELDEVEAILFTEPQRVSEFPPLAALSIRRLHERISRDRRVKVSPMTFQWSDAAGLAAVAERLDKEIQTGNYLAFFIDPLRANRDLDDFREASESFTRESLLKVSIPNLSHAEALPRQTVDLMRSPVVLDHTYLLDPPAGDTLGKLSREMAFFPRYKPGSVFLFVWDWSLDAKKPIWVCHGSATNPKCVDINTASFRCSTWGRRAIECLRENNHMDERRPAPRIEAHFIPREILGSTCISHLRYTTQGGQDVRIDAPNLIAMSRRVLDDEMRNAINACRYDLQNASVSSDGGRDRASVGSFAVKVEVDQPVAITAESCRSFGYRTPLLYGQPTLARYQMDKYLLRVARALNTLPYLPTAAESGYPGEFEQKGNRCLVRVKANGKNYACTVSRIVTNRWLAPRSSLAGSESPVRSPGDIWNNGTYPDLTEPVRCEVIDDQSPAPSKASEQAKSAEKQQANSIDLLEATGIEHELQAFGAGHGSSCDTSGYTDITYRIRLDLGLRALQRGLCSPKDPPRKTRLEAALGAHAQRLQGCFTAAGMLQYQQRSEQWLASILKDCTGPHAKRLMEFMHEATEWTLARP
jgi:hypothetical protein